MISYQLPDTDELVRLGEEHPGSLSIYIPTDPTPKGREKARTALKSAFDEGVRGLRGRGATRAQEQALRDRWSQIAGDGDLWGNLSRTLVVFASGDDHTEYVLPNQLEAEVHFGDHFDVSQLVRAVTTPQHAFALTFSINGWDLWEASADSRVAKLELAGNHPSDAADATNRGTISGPQLNQRLGGDQGETVLRENYARIIGDAVTKELRPLDLHNKVPLFIFATDPMLALIAPHLDDRRLVAVHGSPDNLQADRIDEVIRERISKVTNEAISERARRIGDGTASGRSVTDLAQVAKAAVIGAVDTLIYDLGATARGHLDPATGDITMDDDNGVDLYSRIAVEVLKNSGEVFAVRSDDVWADVWNGSLLAGLRHSLAG